MLYICDFDLYNCVQINASCINNMTFHNLHIIDIAIIIGYLAVCLVIGFLTSKKIKNIRDYAIGSGHISTAVLVGTFFATDIGAGETLGTISQIQRLGLLFVIGFMFRPILWLAASFIFGKNIRYFKESGCISISDIMEKTYGSTARWICNVTSFGFSMGVVALQIIAINYLLQYFLGISSIYCALITFAILVLYSVMGGIKAVAFTDLLQAVVFFIGIPLACFLAVDSLDVSTAQAIQSIPSTHMDIDFSPENIVLIFSVLLRNILGGTDITFMQRYLMANNETQLKKAMRECFYLSIPFTIIIIMCGFVVTLISGTSAQNTSFYYLIDNYLPVGIKGFVITGMLAVIMSTADSWLNTSSVMLAHDILGKVFPKFLNNKRMLIAVRISTISIGFASALFAIFYSKGLMDFMWLIDNIWAPIMIVPLIYALIYKSSYTSTFVAASCSALIGVSFGWYVTGELARVSTLTGILGSAIGLFGAHYWQKGLPEFRLKVALKLPCIRGAWRSVLNFSEKQVRTHGHNYFLAGGLGIMYFISSIFLYNPHSTSGMLLCVRSISALLCIGLIFHERLELKASHQKYLALYYHLVLMVIFPLISGYMMLLTGFSAFWVMSFLLAIIMMNFVCGITMTALLTPLGLLGAHMLWKETGSLVLPIPASMVHIGFTIILLVITARVRHNLQRSLIEIREMYSTMIAHQVMQPISEMSMNTAHLSGLLSPITENVQVAKALGIETKDIVEAKKVLRNLESMGHKGTELVRGLLMMSREDIAHAQDIGAYTIQDVIDSALSIYSEKEKARINLDKSQNFRFNGSKMFMVEVIRNLISNSFKYAGPKAEIEIKCGKRALFIRDNGRGIEQDRLPYIFDPTRNSNGQTTGTGFGLAFVKRVIDTFSCSIICRSELGKYTEFAIGFPRL
jgi:Na+/proline symporter/signal transduction histidine kinase